MLVKIPELTEISKQVKRKCILDGELFILKDGHPNFAAIQRRSLMSDYFKISLDAKKYPATFVAFDILYIDDHATLLLPLSERKKLLTEAVTDSPRMAVSKHFACGTALFNFVLQSELEHPAGHGNERAVWISPDLVCTVKFMHYTASGGMRQPVFKGLFDKLAKDCIAIK